MDEVAYQDEVVAVLKKSVQGMDVSVHLLHSIQHKHYGSCLCMRAANFRYHFFTFFPLTGRGLEHTTSQTNRASPLGDSK